VEVEVFAEIPSGSRSWKFLKSGSLGNTATNLTLLAYFALARDSNRRFREGWSIITYVVDENNNVKK
jgi:hypothetical protein